MAVTRLSQTAPADRAGEEERNRARIREARSRRDSPLAIPDGDREIASSSTKRSSPR